MSDWYYFIDGDRVVGFTPFGTTCYGFTTTHTAFEVLTSTGRRTLKLGVDAWPTREDAQIALLNRSLDALSEAVKLNRDAHQRKERPMNPQSYFCTESADQLCPPMRVVSEPNRFAVTVDLPGYAIDGVEFQDDELVVKAVRQPPIEYGIIDTRSYGSVVVRQKFNPGTVDVENVAADFRGGVLTVVLPKAPSARRKVVAVNCD